MKYGVVNKETNSVWISSESVDDYQRINPESYTIDYLEKFEIIVTSSTKVEKLVNLTNFISHITGFETEKYIKYVETGIPFIRIVNLKDFFVELNNVKFISQGIYDFLVKYHLEEGDILLSKDGSIGIGNIVGSSIVPSISSSHVVTIKSNPSLIDPYYLVTFFNSQYGKIQCLNLSTGSIQKALNVEKIRGIKIPIPSPEIQKYIGDKVRKAEQLREKAIKILNNARNETKKLLSEEHKKKVDSREYDIIKTRPSGTFHN